MKKQNMILSTSDDIGKKHKVLGLVRGNTVRSRWFGRDIAASLKSLVGGEIVTYTEMLTASRDEATERMVKEAKKLGADAIVTVRYTTAEPIPGSTEILAYGTAVKFL